MVGPEGSSLAACPAPPENQSFTMPAGSD